MNLKQTRAALAALIHVRDNGNESPWVHTAIQKYQEEVTRLMLLDGQPEPEFVPYQDENGDWIINKWGDRDNDI
ncbi:hypothetical protein [Rhizobium sp.]|uniref:hypothetical protein n=1 Tax=Rhizobium sp. TaxID=391 RepID=UPI0034C62DD3